MDNLDTCTGYQFTPSTASEKDCTSLVISAKECKAGCDSDKYCTGYEYQTPGDGTCIHWYIENLTSDGIANDDYMCFYKTIVMSWYEDTWNNYFKGFLFDLIKIYDGKVISYALKYFLKYTWSFLTGHDF